MVRSRAGSSSSSGASAWRYSTFSSSASAAPSVSASVVSAPTTSSSSERAAVGLLGVQAFDDLLRPAMPEPLGDLAGARRAAQLLATAGRPRR